MSFIEVAQAWYSTGGSPLFPDDMTFWYFLLTVISIFVLVAWILSIIFVLYWGLLLILSWWKEDKIKPAINTIRYAIFWLIITVASIFLFPILGDLLWIDVEQYARPINILERIKELGNDIFGSTNSTYGTPGSNITPTETWDIPADFSDL